MIVGWNKPLKVLQAIAFTLSVKILYETHSE